MKRYDSYKDSGVEWLGEIPSHWRKSKFKFVSDLYTGNSLNDSQKLQYESENLDDIPYVSSKDIDVEFQTVNYNNGLRIPRENNPLKISPKGSFLMVIEGGSSGRKKVYLEQDVCFVNKLCSFNSRENNKFQYYFIQSSNYQDKFKLSMSGLIGGVSISNLKDFELTLPPLPEQQQIVSFLDTKTSLIDSLIEKTQRKIELLKEKRTSLINEVVTKGLNPNVEMKDSGVEWIGEIPSHWDRLPLKNFGQVTLGKMLTSEDKGGYHLRPYLRSQNIQTERVNTSDIKEMWFSDSELEKLRLEKGDLLFNEGGDVGRTCIWLNEIDECYIQNSVNRVRFENDDERYYLHLSILYHSVGYYDSLVNRVSIPHLTKEKLESVIFLRPPLSEQQQIVEYLDEQTQLIDKTISIEEKRIELLKEYRQSLISEVVTGKLKVVE